MTDDGPDPDSKEGAAFNAREDALEAAMPVLAEFFHIVRCPNHSKADRTAAYEAACEVWDVLEDAYLREVVVSNVGGESPDRNPGRGNHGDHGEYGGEGRIGTKPDGEAAPYVTHPGSRAIN